MHKTDYNIYCTKVVVLATSCCHCKESAVMNGLEIVRRLVLLSPTQLKGTSQWLLFPAQPKPGENLSWFYHKNPTWFLKVRATQIRLQFPAASRLQISLQPIALMQMSEQCFSQSSSPGASASGQHFQAISLCLALFSKFQGYDLPCDLSFLIV